MEAVSPSQAHLLMLYLTLPQVWPAGFPVLHWSGMVGCCQQVVYPQNFCELLVQCTLTNCMPLSVRIWKSSPTLLKMSIAAPATALAVIACKGTASGHLVAIQTAVRINWAPPLALGGAPLYLKQSVQLVETQQDVPLLEPF